MTSPRPTSPLLAAALLSAVLVASVAGCGSPVASPSTGAAGSPIATAPPGSPGPTATAAASASRAEGWRADLALLVPGMATIHPDLEHSVSRAALDAAVAALASAVDTATDDELMVGVLGIVAMVSAAGCDAHTGAFVWGSGTYPVDSLPLRLWLFANEDDDDEVVVVDALAPYAHLIGARIDTIQGHPIADVLAAIDPIVPRDNPQTVRLLMPRFLLTPQVLRGLGLANDGPISLGLSPVAGAPLTVDVEPVTIAEYNAWAGPYGLHLPADPAVPYLSRIGDALWWEMLPDGETLYVQYNRVDRLTAVQTDPFEAALADSAVARFVLDIRHNFGGELSALNEMTPILVDAAAGLSDRLFVVTGRNTFSAGSMLAARLERLAKVTMVGEATGGCPTIWSDPSNVELPWSGISVSVAGDIAVGVDRNDARLTIEPDAIAQLETDEWAAGEDPALGLLEVAAP